MIGIKIKLKYHVIKIISLMDENIDYILYTSLKNNYYLLKRNYGEY